MKRTQIFIVVIAMASVIAVKGKEMDLPAFRHLDAIALLRWDFSIFQLKRGAGDRLEFTERDRDLMIRTVYGEAVHEPRLGQMAVAWVIRNRYKSNPYGWNTLAKVVTACGYTRRKKRRVKVCQFEPWLSRKKAILALNSDSVYYRQLGAVVDDVLQGRTSDPTNGAWYFLNKVIVQKRRRKQGRNMPKWAQNCTDIGRHSFCKPGKQQTVKASFATVAPARVWRYLKRLVAWDV